MRPMTWHLRYEGHAVNETRICRPMPEKRANVGDALGGGMSRRCSDAVNSLPIKGYATCQTLPLQGCPIHPDFALTLWAVSSGMGPAS